MFGSTAFPPDGEMGPYPLSDQMPPDGEMGPYPLSDNMLLTDGEMGPYPLSDNTNLLGPNSTYGISLYRNYGSNYGTNYATNYAAKYYKKKSYASSSYGNCSGTGAGTDSYLNCSKTGLSGSSQMCYYQTSHCKTQKSKSNSSTKCNTPVPTRRCYAKRERDSFRRHSAHGRISSQGTN